MKIYKYIGVALWYYHWEHVRPMIWKETLMP